jgi:hypothetical protein
MSRAAHRRTSTIGPLADSDTCNRPAVDAMAALALPTLAPNVASSLLTISL